MIDTIATSKRLISRALSTAPTDNPWAWITTPGGTHALLYRISDNPDDGIMGTYTAGNETPKDVYANIKSGVDTRSPIPRAELGTLLTKGATLIESPALHMLHITAPGEPTRIAIMTPESILHVTVKATSKRGIEGFPLKGDDIVDEIVFSHRY